MDVSVWATVVAALGASALTGTVALVVPAVQRRYLRQDTAATERATAYEDFANTAVAFALRVEMGVGAGTSIACFARRGLDEHKDGRS